MPTDPPDEFLARLADNSPELVERIVGRQLENIEESGLDPKIHALVRIASLVSVGAPAASFAWQVAMAREAGASDDEIGGVLVAVAPTAGLPAWLPRRHTSARHWPADARPGKERHDLP